MFAVVEGTNIKVGDYVCFKRDYECYDKVVKIRSTEFDAILNVAVEDEYDDEVIVSVLASDCWIE